MEEINIKELYEYYLSKLKYILIIMAIVLVVGIIYGAFMQKNLYTSSTTLVLVGGESNSDESITQNDVLLNQKLISTYREIIKSRKILSQVIRELDLNMSVDELSSVVSVVNVQDTELIKINVQSKNPSTAKDIANKLASVFSKNISEVYNIKNISIIDKASLPTKNNNKSMPKIIIISIVLGFVLSLGIIFVIFYFDNSIKSKETIENKFGLPVLGTVSYNSHYNGKGKKKHE